MLLVIAFKFKLHENIHYGHNAGVERHHLHERTFRQIGQEHPEGAYLRLRRTAGEHGPAYRQCRRGGDDSRQKRGSGQGALGGPVPAAE